MVRINNTLSKIEHSLYCIKTVFVCSLATSGFNGCLRTTVKHRIQFHFQLTLLLLLINYKYNCNYTICSVSVTDNIQSGDCLTNSTFIFGEFQDESK